MTKKIKVGLMGGTGYAAAELIRRLVSHPQVELTKIASIDHVGENVGDVHRNFGKSLPYRLENLTPEELASGNDLVFLALPHKISAQMAPRLMPSGAKIIDFSGDYRLQNPQVYEKYYQLSHPNPQYLSAFVYGLPELQREKIIGARYLANPGCFPTATALALIPLAKQGLLTGKIRVVGATGSSGSGVHPQATTHHPTRAGNLKSYRPLYHQHQPEMLQTLVDAGGKNLSLDFIPMSAPLVRGILVNAIVDLEPNITDQDIFQIYQQYYQAEYFIRYLGSKLLPEVVNVAGSNFVEIGHCLKEEENGKRTLVVIAAIDNLVKGAAGQAIQNMNLMFHFPENLALNDFGTWP